jgi:hypothetical protein
MSSLKLTNLFSKSIDVGEDTIAENKKTSDAVASKDLWYPAKNG